MRSNNTNDNNPNNHIDDVLRKLMLNVASVGIAVVACSAACCMAMPIKCYSVPLLVSALRLLTISCIIIIITTTTTTIIIIVIIIIFIIIIIISPWHHVTRRRALSPMTSCSYRAESWHIETSHA